MVLFRPEIEICKIIKMNALTIRQNTNFYRYFNIKIRFSYLQELFCKISKVNTISDYELRINSTPHFANQLYIIS